MNEKSDDVRRWLFFYGLALAVFHVLPPFLNQFFLWPLSWGDAFDFLTPFAVIPFAFLLYSCLNRISRCSGGQESSARSLNILAKVILALGFISYVEGHGLHLSANSIARLLQEMKGSELFEAAYLFDEIISHHIWISGLFLISLGLILISCRVFFQPLNRNNMILLSAGSLLYGFTFSVEAIEGQTVALAFPAAVLGFILSVFLYLKRKRLGAINPVLLFFAGAYLMSVLLFSYWGITRSGFPQFSELGWI
jgi:hypothetical protein